MSVIGVRMTNHGPGYPNNSASNNAGECPSATHTASLRKGSDTLEISREAYRLQSSNGNRSASSGKDVFGITKGEKEDSFVLHFSDSALVSRAISRGFVTVNGVKISLSDEEKKRLREADSEAQKKREAAYVKYVMAHEMAVARQQTAALSGAYQEMSQAMRMISKIIGGGKAAGEDLASRGVSWNDFEWERYETQMTVSLAGKSQTEDA